MPKGKEKTHKDTKNVLKSQISWQRALKGRGDAMKSALEIRKFRCGKGFMSQRELAQAVTDAGCKMTRQGLAYRESGQIRFSAKEIRTLAKVLCISLEEAYEYFCED